MTRKARSKLWRFFPSLCLVACVILACADPLSENASSNPANADLSAAQQEIDEIYSLLAMAVVYKDWQSGKDRGHNIGSVLVDPASKPVFWGRNTRYITGNGSDHGEIRLIRNYLDCIDDVEFLNEQKEHPYPGGKPGHGFTLYTTLDPCVMCTGMMLMTKLSRAIYVQADPEYGDVADRLAGDKPYPITLDIDQAGISEARMLDAGYRSWGKTDDITYYLRSEAARKIYESATQRLREFKSAHGNEADIAAALRFLDEVVDSGYQPDMSLECPATTK